MKVSELRQPFARAWFYYLWLRTVMVLSAIATIVYTSYGILVYEKFLVGTLFFIGVTVFSYILKGKAFWKTYIELVKIGVIRF